MKTFKEHLLESQINDIEQHLRDRGIDPKKTRVITDKKNNYAVFLLYNLSGKLVGYQNYNPNADKSFHQGKPGSKKMSTEELLAKMRYYTHSTKIGKVNEIAVYGLETLKETDRVLFITEGVFDIVKIHNQGLPGIAVLANDPQKLRPWLSILPQKKIVIYDNDSAGKKVMKLGDFAYTVPEPFKDLGEMSDLQVSEFLKTIKY
jgi:Icc-related predicted phosphoesterase